MGERPQYSQESDERDCIRRAVEQQVRLALWDLGATHSAIARALKEQSIAGLRRSRSDCPVAHYLRLNLGLQGVRVSGFLVTELLGKNDDASVVLPRAVREFVERFDRGFYGELAIPSQRMRRVGAKGPNVVKQRGKAAH